MIIINKIKYFKKKKERGGRRLWVLGQNTLNDLII